MSLDAPRWPHEYFLGDTIKEFTASREKESIRSLGESFGILDITIGWFANVTYLDTFQIVNYMYVCLYATRF